MCMRKMNEALTEVESEEDLTLKGPISRIAVSPLEDHLAYGGKENEAQVYDIETGKVTWTARNVGNNFLDLRWDEYTCCALGCGLGFRVFESGNRGNNFLHFG